MLKTVLLASFKSVIGVGIAVIIIGVYGWVYDEEVNISLTLLSIMILGVFVFKTMHELWRSRNIPDNKYNR
ncbi:MAG: hypothetical protein WD317_09220 [Balneolaceae bacterium]